MREALATLGVLIVGAGTIASMGWVLLQAQFSNVGGMTLLMLTMAAGLTLVAVGIGLGGAWLLWRAGLKYASMFLAFVGVIVGG